MQDREYVYARRVWRRPADGGCYALSMPCRHPAAPLSPGSVVHVTDHASGFRIRAVPSAQGSIVGVQTCSRQMISAVFGGVHSIENSGFIILLGDASMRMCNLAQLAEPPCMSMGNYRQYLS